MKNLYFYVFIMSSVTNVTLPILIRIRPVLYCSSVPDHISMAIEAAFLSADIIQRVHLSMVKQQLLKQISQRNLLVFFSFLIERNF